MRAELVACAMGCGLAACGGPTTSSAPDRAGSPSPTAAPTATAEPVHIETNGSGDQYVTLVQRVSSGPSRPSRIVYALRALSSRAEIAGSESEATFERPHISFYDRGGKTLIADAPQAKVTQRDKSVVMSGGVHARAEDGSLLRCDVLRYDGRTEMLHGQGHVALTSPSGVTLTGRYLAGNVRLDDVRVAEYPL